jgi:nitroimidazol reductase NimA-like FMN-containing flavoprotein (pyridoxamine 5'-phosphate oxidase superfamily)
MRRKDREISDPEELESIICRADVCRLALCSDGVPYVVPLCFGYQEGVIYFHSATEGRKLEMLRKNSRVCFEMDIDHELIRFKDRCSMRYRSVIGFGKASMVEDQEEKARALDLMMLHYHQEPFSYPEEALQRTAIIKVDIEELTGKVYGH